MLWKTLGGIVGAALLLMYVAPVVLRLKEYALSAVVLLALGMMLADLWQSLQSKDD